MARFGRYELGRVLGEGGAGRVYEAVLVGPGGFRKDVALKVLRGGSAALKREARIGGLLRHQNLVDVYEVGEVEGQWFCALERCDGSLAGRGALPPKAVVEVGLQVCAALQYAHEELGLVHRDLKPANLLLKGVTVKVADLGIARAEGFGDRGGIRGTPGYMAPEQARGGRVDARADIWALGVTLAELATGRRPGAVGTLDLDSLDADPPDASAPEPSPHVPAWLEPVVRRCLAFDPEDRWSSLDELALALAALPAEGPGLREVLGGPASTTPLAAERALGPESDAFFGRRDELDRLATLLRTPGVTTLKGPGGIGKSRLAVAALRAWQVDHGGGGWFVELADVAALDGLVRAVALALDLRLREGEGEASVDRIGHALGARGASVLALDNFEQIVALAPVVARWRVLAPEIRVIVTSREPLRLDGERVIEVGPLDHEAAAALVVERARRRGVAVEAGPELGELTRRLDGHPLALELAAGRLGVLGVSEVLERLGLALLRQGTEGRHAALETTLAWSWNLLAPVERATLGQLSVFVGGFTLEAAEEVVVLAEGTVLDAVAGLVDRSMVRALPDGRFDLLVGVQAFAAARVEEREAAEARHGRWLARFGADETLDALHGRGGSARQKALARELDNLVAACRRAVARGDRSVAVPVLCAACAVFALQGPFDVAVGLAESVLPLVDGRDEGRVRLAAGQALQQAGRHAEAEAHLLVALERAEAARDPRTSGAATYGLATRAADRGRIDEAEARMVSALAAHQAVGARYAEGRARCGLAILYLNTGRPTPARAQFDLALAIAEALGDRRLESVVVGNLAVHHQMLGDGPAARALHVRALALHRAVGDRSAEAHALGNLASILHGTREWDEERELLDEQRRIALEIGDRRTLGIGLVNLGNLLHAQGANVEGRARLVEALALLREIGERFWLALALGTLGLLLADTDEGVEGRAHLDEAIAVAREAGIPRVEAYWLACRARLFGVDQAWDRAVELLARAWSLADQAADPPMRAVVRAVEAEVAARRGHLDDARAALAAAESLAPGGDSRAAGAVAAARRAVEDAQA